GRGRMRGGTRLIVEIGAAYEPHEAPISGFRCGDQYQRVVLFGMLAPARASRLRKNIVERDSELAADDGLYALLGRLLRKLQRAEEIVRVGDGDGRRLIVQRMVDNLAEGQRAFQQGIGRMNPEMDEIALWPPLHALHFRYQRIMRLPFARHAGSIPWTHIAHAIVSDRAPEVEWAVLLATEVILHNRRDGHSHRRPDRLAARPVS